jgi:hypothetical protein
MSDIKSALHAALFRAPTHVQTVVQKTIEEWDEEGEKHFPINNPSVPTSVPVQTNLRVRVINNVMRETFNCIKANPGLRNKEIAAVLLKQGFKTSSVTSIPSQLLHAGLVERRDGTYYTIVDEYQPIGPTDKRKVTALKKKVAELKEVAKSRGIADLPVQAPAQGLAALAAAPAHTEPTAQEPPKAKRFAMLVTPQPPEQIVKGMTAYQARELYDHLKQLFGG